jgi:general secretion pathway protein D
VQSDALSLDRYDMMRGKQEAAQPPNSIVTPVNAGPLMPPVTRPVPNNAPARPPVPPAWVPPPLGQ